MYILNKKKCINLNKNRKQALINDYFEQFVTCHDTMQEVCGKLHDELSDATGNINGLVESYEG